MNAVMDLTARAVSFITLIQDTVLNGALHLDQDKNKLDIKEVLSENFPVAFEKYRKASSAICQEKFKVRAIELVWISKKEPDEKKVVEYTLTTCNTLVHWIYTNKILETETLKTCGSFPTPYIWREAIIEYLYAEKQERIHLSTALQYLPIQIVLALGGGRFNVRNQRILQLWKISDEDINKLLTTSEINAPAKPPHFTVDNAEHLLIDETRLLNELMAQEAPLSFELIFKCELEEINRSRQLRHHERCISHATESITEAVNEPKTDNPFVKAKEMNLYALAFSGGGIRSATFNLGILQGFAKKGLINKFDYLSTVSGGGYIGSWLAAWISREGSVTKVNDRLNPEKSPDPFGEELWPIRWLRMFSNYFSPQSSIMSVDSWTIGVTWLRNMLLNQLIILLLLLSLFLTVRILFEVWIDGHIWTAGTTEDHLLIWTIIFLIPVSFLAGAGMQSYHRERFPPVSIRRQESVKVSNVLLLICLVAAFVLSSTLYYHIPIGKDVVRYSFLEKMMLLKYHSLVIFFSLSLIALYGRYDTCLRAHKISLSSTMFNIVVTAAISAIIGVFCLAWGWEILELIKQRSVGHEAKDGINIYNAIAFIVGLPMLVLILGIVVVSRMALLGRYFPDERREWWGRIGGSVNRVTFIFILLAGSSLIGYRLASDVYKNVAPTIVTAGGWLALVGAAVKSAFNSSSSGKEKPSGALATVQELLSKAGPYIFVLGLLVFLPALLPPILSIKEKFLNGIGLSSLNTTLRTGIFTALILTGSYLLARRLGVNEFSMHHFYRNRLVRAYLGATRRHVERQSTSNPFTDFDMWDDLKISKLQNQYGYYGPYLLLNTALNASQVSQLDRQDRKAESFIFSPLFCGFDFSMSRAADNINMKSYDYGFRKTENFAYKDGGPGIGTAMAISGAAINPNQGYHSSTATAFLLTVFNVQMGWWIGNPRKSAYKYADPRSGLAYIIQNLTGKTNTRKNFVSLSDGGHFDNMGLYELVRRRVPFIILGDAEQDDQFTCEGLANAIRRCRIDFGTEISINTDKITKRNERNFSEENYSIGSIKYAGDPEPTGVLLYIKSSITDKVSVDVREYALKNKSFPHQTTGDQFFDEEQFESYRRLGMSIADLAMNDNKVLEALKLMGHTSSLAVKEEKVNGFSKLWEQGSKFFKAYILMENEKDKGETPPSV